MTFGLYKRSEYMRMLIIAVIGAVLGFITYEIIYYLNPFHPKATLSWITAFIIGVARQHALHRRFTFFHKVPYFKSLYKAYVVDLGALLYSSILYWFLSEFLHLDHRLTWVVCLLSTALINVLFLKRYVFKAITKSN